MIVTLRGFLHILNELQPSFITYFPEHRLEKLSTLVHIHFVVQLAEIAIALRGLPTFIMLAFIHAHHVWLVLAEI